MEKELIIFTDSGDTIVDEATQKFDEKGIVTDASFIPGAEKVLRDLHNEGFTIALVADGEWDSFQNVYNKHDLASCFDSWTVSERVGQQKPAQIMFSTAFKELGLKIKDKRRIVMIGNNLKKDIAGANRFGITSIWLDWSPRYFHSVEDSDWEPDYTVSTPYELYELIHTLNGELLREKAEKELFTKNILKDTYEKLGKVISAFTPILYEDDEKFLENMKGHNLAGDDIRLYQHWEWTQGVGLFGLWKVYEKTSERRYLDLLKDFYDKQIAIGFPALNVNTAAPYLAMSFLGEELKEEKYLKPCREAAEKIYKFFPRTKEGGFRHMTSDSENEGELWDDTLFMTVLFLANMGRIEKRKEYLEEAAYQFLLHARYLQDKTTGLWYHGWSFIENNNFAGAFWGRGNCWVTMAIPEFLAIYGKDDAVSRQLIAILKKQTEALIKYQDKSGMWHTLVDDETSYVEASATCGFAYGMMRAANMGFVNPECYAVALKALPAILDCITPEGEVSQVSYGTPMGRTTKDFYKNIELKRMPYGQALALLFLLECVKES